MMGIYTKLAYKYIILNKTKSIIMVLGFALAITLALSIASVFDSIITTEIYRQKIDSFGYDFGYSGITIQNISSVKKDIIKDKNVESIGIVREFGSTLVKDGLDAYLRGYDGTAVKMFGIKLKEGALPQKYNEVCLEEYTLLNMKNKPQIGQKFILNVKDNSGHIQKNEYILSGILKDTKDNTLSLNSVNIVLVNYSAYSNKSNTLLSLYVKLKHYAGLYNKSLKILNDINLKYSSKNQFINLHFIKNEHFLNNLGLLNNFETYKTLLMLFSVGVAVLIVFNLLSISITERIRQYGLLRSIGTSGKQIRLIIVIEAVLLSLPSIPIGTAAGYTFARVLVNIISPILVNRRIYSVFNIKNVIFVSVAIILAAIITSLIPGRKVDRLTPIEACRHTDIGNGVKKRKNALEFLAGRFFDIIKVMAVCNINRNKSKAFFIVASLSLSGFIFLTIFYFYIFISDPQIGKSTITSDFELQVDIGGSERYTVSEMEEIQKINGVEEVYGYNTVRGYTFIFADKRFVEGYKASWAGAGFYLYGNFVSAGAGLLGCNDTLLYKLNVDKNILQDMKRNDNDFCGIFSTRLDRNKASSLFELIHKESEIYVVSKRDIDLNAIKKFSPKIQPCATMFINDSVPFGYGVSAYYMTNSSFEKLTGLEGYSNIYVNIRNGADRNKIASELHKLANLKSSGKLDDAAMQLGIVRKFFSQISMLVLGLSILILVIGIISMFITLKSSIILRMSELAVLRAIGISRKDLRKMFIYEGLYYGALSSTISSVISVFFCCTVFSLPELYTNPFISAFLRIPWTIFISVFLGNIVLCIAVTLISVRPLYSISIVEAIRNE